MLYFDNQTAAPITKEVAEVVHTYLTQQLVSPLSHHRAATRLWAPMEEALETIYHFVGSAPEDHFVLTSSGSEAINHVVFTAYIEQARKLGKNHFLTTTMEEAPMIKAMHRLQEMACHVERVPANSLGMITKEAVEEMITPRTALLSLSWANGMTGVIQPIADIAELCKRRGILLHLDGTHILGKGAYHFAESGADFLTFNGEQLHGPKGCGGLFIRKGVEVVPFIVGDKEQQELRAGGYNVALLMGLSKAAEQMAAHQDNYGLEIASLRAYFEERLSHVSLNPFAGTTRIPNVSLLLFPKISSEVFAYYLAEEKVAVSFGGNHFQKISHLLQAAKVDEDLIHTGVSFAFSREHRQKEIDQLIAIILETLATLQKMRITL